VLLDKDEVFVKAQDTCAVREAGGPSINSSHHKSGCPTHAQLYRAWVGTTTVAFGCLILTAGGPHLNQPT
jgi:hypothetical protein